MIVQDGYRRFIIEMIRSKKASVLERVTGLMGVEGLPKHERDQQLRRLEAEVDGFTYGAKQPVKYGAKAKIAVEKGMLEFFKLEMERSLREHSEWRRRACALHKEALAAYEEGAAETEEKLRAVTEKREDLLGALDLDTLESKQYLARALTKAKNLKKGLPLWREVVMGRETVQGFGARSTIAT